MTKTLKFCAILLILSCTTNKHESSKLTQINLNEGFSNYKKINLSKIANKIKYIPLETTNNSILSRITAPHDNVLFIKEGIIVSDKNYNICLFDYRGKYINSIGKKGKGPGEYLDASSITTIMNDSIVVILSGYKSKLYFYNLQGKFIKSLDVKNAPSMVKGYNSNKYILVHPSGRRFMTDYHTFKMCDFRNKNDNNNTLFFQRHKEKEFEKKKKLKKNAFKVSYYKISDNYYYWEYNRDTIWNIKNNKVFPYYHINYDHKMPYKLLTEPHTFARGKKYNHLWRFYDTSRYMFFNFGSRGKKRVIYYDKLNKYCQGIRYKSKYNKLKFSFFNDIDGGLDFWPTGVVSENKIFSIIYGYQLKKHLKENPLSKELKNTEKGKKLQQLANNSSIDNNPILMIVNLKE